MTSGHVFTAFLRFFLKVPTRNEVMKDVGKGTGLFVVHDPFDEMKARETYDGKDEVIFVPPPSSRDRSCVVYIGDVTKLGM